MISNVLPGWVPILGFLDITEELGGASPHASLRESDLREKVDELINSYLQSRVESRIVLDFEIGESEAREAQTPAWSWELVELRTQQYLEQMEELQSRLLSWFEGAE